MKPAALATMIPAIISIQEEYGMILHPSLYGRFSSHRIQWRHCLAYYVLWPRLTLEIRGAEASSFASSGA